MDPNVSKTLLSLVNTLPGGEGITEKFPLIFQLTLASTGGPTQFNVATNSGTQVNVGQITRSTSTSEQQQPIAIPIKVINPARKRDCKSYMLNLEVEKVCHLSYLREEILEQLSKEVVSFNLKFDVGCFRGSQRICFTAGDNIAVELQQLKKSGKCLWCDGLKRSECDEPICLDSDSDDEGIKTKKRKIDKEANAFEAKVKRVDALANELREQHKEKFNKIQYKLWAEALDSGRHRSKDAPPCGTIWSSDKSKSGKKSTDCVDVMASAFTHMANTVASAFSNPSNKGNTSPHKEEFSKVPSVISPGRRIDYQDKLFKQLDLLHSMYDRGALTAHQFEKRRDALLAQLDSLD